MGEIKQIEIKTRTYYFYNDLFNIEKFNSSLLKTDKKSYKDVDIQCIGYITIKSIGDCENIYSVNPMYLITGEVDEHIECYLLLKKKIRVNIQFLIVLMKTKKY